MFQARQAALAAEASPVGRWGEAGRPEQAPDHWGLRQGKCQAGEPCFYRLSRDRVCPQGLGLQFPTTEVGKPPLPRSSGHLNLKP